MVNANKNGYLCRKKLQMILFSRICMGADGALLPPKQADFEKNSIFIYTKLYIM